MTWVEILGFLIAREGLIMALVDAINNGMTEESLLALIKGAMVAASDAEMKRELG